jgi:transposase-like protein
MPISLFDDGSVEIACPRCSCTSPRTTAWVRANDRFTCPACNSDMILDQDKQLAGSNEPTIG